MLSIDFVNSIKYVFVPKESDSYSIEIQCLSRRQFLRKKTSYFWRLYHKKTYDIESECRSFKMFLPASFWMKKLESFVKSLKIKCVGG